MEKEFLAVMGVSHEGGEFNEEGRLSLKKISNGGERLKRKRGVRGSEGK